jgi:hypothetical protein
MAELKTKLMTLAGIATMFAGMAHAQITGCTIASNPIFVAAEGTTEQVADAVVSCPATAAASTINLTVYLSPAVTITSATLGSGGGARSETMAGQTASFTAGGATASDVVAGTVSGSSVSFNGIQIPAATAVNITITNIKINASQIAASSGAPTPVTETVFIGGTNVTPTVLAATNVAFAANALSGVTTLKGDGSAGTPSSIQICTGVTAFDVTKPSFEVQFAEGFPSAFKVKSDAATNATLGSEFAGGNNSYTGYGVTAPTANTATSGTRVQIVFNNIPANVNVYLPLTVSNGGGTVSAVTSLTGALGLANPTTAAGSPGSSDNTHSPAGTSTYMQLTVSNGSATAIYEETATAGNVIETFTVPVFLQASAAAVAAPSSAITATVSLGPVGSTSSVPNFVSGSSTATKNGNSFSACSTTLLFPFVTNQLGFDTGLAIANASSDLLASNGTKSQAAKQSGTCTLTFFGDTAPAAVTTNTINSGSVYAAAASTVAPGFQGYMIASCNFLYGHGFAYVVYNLTQNNGAAMGYLADAITGDRKSQISSGSVSSTSAGGVLTGVSGSVGTTGVGSNTPEQ